MRTCYERRLEYMPDYLNYQRSVAAEFKALEKRVRDLIDDANWGEEGRYKEVVLKNYLRRVLPENLSVGTGFVRNGDEITKQIDIIIFDNTYPLLFSEGDFVITTSYNVVGIIEVKSSITPSKLFKIMKNANDNAYKIAKGMGFRYRLFNGIFSYDAGKNIKRYYTALEKCDFSDLLDRENQVISPKLYHCVNNMTLGGSFFIKLFSTGGDHINATYKLCEMQDNLAFSYFISSLQEFISDFSTNEINEDYSVFSTNEIKQDHQDKMKKFLYPSKAEREMCVNLYNSTTKSRV